MAKAEQTREMIIEKAAILFNKKGVVGTSISDILAVTKVAKGCLYGHFESKEALAQATVDYLMARIAKESKVLIARQSKAKLKVAAFMELFTDSADSPFMEGGCPVLNFGVDSDDTDPVIKKKVRESLVFSTRLLVDILKEGIDKGELSPKLDPKKMALKILAILEGAVLISRVMESSAKMDSLIEMTINEIEQYEIS